MAGIFTRKAITDILNSEDDITEKVAQIMSLNGRNLENSYVSKAIAEEEKQNAVENALANAKNSVESPDVKGSEEYKALESSFNAYKAKQAARGSDDFKSVKSKFFDVVYDKIDMTEGAKPIDEQLATIRKDYEEYFTPTEQPEQPNKPTFGGETTGNMPTGYEKGSFAKQWGYGKRKDE